MCRLLGLSGGRQSVRATFWLVEAPDSLAEQSRRNPDGYGLGTFEADGTPDVDKGAVAAWQDARFAQEARDEQSTTFIAHVRYASTGAVAYENSHPFEQHGRLFAHHGLVEGLEDLERELGQYRSLVAGQTDSERFFALMTRHVDEHHGDVKQGIELAVRWVAEYLPVYAINFVLTTPTDLFAFRYPEPNTLFVLERAAGGPSGGRHLDHTSAGGTVRVRSGELADQPSVVVASERMDEDPGWRALRSGELLHVNADLGTRTEVLLDRPPKHQLTLEDLDLRAAASQSQAGDEVVASPQPNRDG